MNQIRQAIKASCLLGVVLPTLFGAQQRPEPDLRAWDKVLSLNGSHLIVPVCNYQKPANTETDSHLITLGIYQGDTLVQSFVVALPQGGDAFWLAAYPIEHFGLKEKYIRLATINGAKAPESCRAAFDRIKVGSAAYGFSPADYTQPYRNQFHASAHRGWNNDPNGLVFHDGKYHLYFQHNPFGIFWGNMHWGHFESTDLINWKEQPIALYQKTAKDMVFSGGGFVDYNNSSGLGANTQFAAFTSTGRGGECLAYSKDGGLTFTELPENPIVKHRGRDPKVFWYQPAQKWVMVVYDETPCDETAAITQTIGPKERSSSHLAFWESKNLRQWRQTGAFTDADRLAVFECPEMFELPIVGKSGETRWILLAAQNRYFIGQFDGRTFHKESGPHGMGHGSFYAAQTFSDVPDGRRIQIGWVRTDAYLQRFPNQIVNQAFTLPHELTLRETGEGLRICFSPVGETEQLRGEVLAEGKDLAPAQVNELLQKCRGELSETLIEFSSAAPRQLVINGIDASFDGRTVRIFTDRTFNEVYANDGLSYQVRKRLSQHFDSIETRLTAAEGVDIRSLKIFRLKSIWSNSNKVHSTN
jgi:fructan beta-fructosidase